MLIPRLSPSFRSMTTVFGGSHVCGFSAAGRSVSLATTGKAALTSVCVAGVAMMSWWMVGGVAGVVVTTVRISSWGDAGTCGELAERPPSLEDDGEPGSLVALGTGDSVELQTKQCFTVTWLWLGITKAFMWTQENAGYIQQVIPSTIWKDAGMEYWLLSTWLWYLQCIIAGDTKVLHQAINMESILCNVRRSCANSRTYCM